MCDEVRKVWDMVPLKTTFRRIEFWQQQHSSKNEHDAHLPTKHPQSTIPCHAGTQTCYALLYLDPKMPCLAMP